MIDGILAAFVPSPIAVLIILIVLGIPILLIVLFFKYLSRSNKERQRLRLELGKLADELEQVRKQAEQKGKEGPSGESG